MYSNLKVSTDVVTLKKLRLENELTQSDVSKAIGLNEGKLGDGSNYGKRERGLTDFSITFLVRLSRLYKVDLEDLLIVTDMEVEPDAV